MLRTSTLSLADPHRLRLMAILPVLFPSDHSILCYDQGLGHPIPLAVHGWMTVISHHLFQSQWAAHGDESL